MTPLLLKASLLATAAALVPAALAAAEQGTRLSLENGWPVVQGSGDILFTEGVGPACDVRVDDALLLEGMDGVVTAVEEHSDGSLVMVYITGRGTLRDRFAPLPGLGAGAWLRSLHYRNTSEETQDLTSALLRVQPATMDGGATWAPRLFRMSEAAPDHVACVSYRGTTDTYNLLEDEGVLEHRVDAAWRLAPGQAARVEAQGFWVAQGRADAFRAQAQDWYRAIGIEVPRNVPDWFHESIMYQASAGGHIDSRFSDVGGFDSFARQAPYLADLGVSSLWLASVHTHKVPPGPEAGWNHYDPRDFAEIDPILGGVDGLKRLGSALRENGIHIIGEIVPHGGNSVQGKALEEDWTYLRDGEPSRNWGGCGMDYASPKWQAEMRDAIALVAEAIGIEGARIDVADGSGPNWGSPYTNHASYSMMAGAKELMEALNDGILSAGHMDGETPILIPESYNRPEYLDIAPLGYSHEMWFFFVNDLPRELTSGPALVAALRDFLETERGSLPEGALVLRKLNNHDTVAEAGRARTRFGVGLARALYGVCLVVPGVPMLYHEDEIGSFHALRRMHLGRRAVPEMAHGDVDYLSVTYDPRVFPSLRSVGDSHAVGLSNLSGEPVEGIVLLPETEGIREGMTDHDAVSGRESRIQDNGFAWSMAPYETAIIRLGRQPEEVDATQRYKGEEGTQAERRPFAVEVDGARVRVVSGALDAVLDPGPGDWRVEREDLSGAVLVSDTGRLELGRDGVTVAVTLGLRETDPETPPALLVTGSDRWYVSGRTALMEDRTIRRHFPYPPEVDYAWDKTQHWGRDTWGRVYNYVSPTGRLWESLWEPLHPDVPGVAFEDAEGRGFALENLETDANNTVLAAHAEDRQFGLGLHFHAPDMDLGAAVRAFGLNPGWRMQSPPEVGNSVAVSFTIRPVAGDAEDRLSAPRLPIDQRGARTIVEAEEWSRDRHGIWLISPGEVRIQNLPAVPGTYRIQLQLRHSELAPDGTDLKPEYAVFLNGRPLSFAWTRLNSFSTGNAYFGHAVTEPVDLRNGPHTLAIRSSDTWCAFRGEPVLLDME